MKKQGKFEENMNKFPILFNSPVPRRKKRDRGGPEKAGGKMKKLRI